MVSGVLSLTTIPLTLCPNLPSKFDSKRSFRYQPTSCSTLRVVTCSNSSPESPATAEKLHNDASVTGGAIDFQRATTSLTQKLLSAPKKVTLVRHGLSSWNNEGRVQGSSNLSILTEIGVGQAERCREALKNIHFDQCFSSPISRAKSTAEVLWQGRDEPLVFLDSLKEAHLFFLEGMKNGRKHFGCHSQINFKGADLHSTRASPGEVPFSRCE